MATRSRSSRTRRATLVALASQLISHCHVVEAAFAVTGGGAGSPVRSDSSRSLEFGSPSVRSVCAGRLRQSRDASTPTTSAETTSSPLDVQSLLALSRPSRMETLNRRVESFPRDGRAHLLLGFEWLRDHEDGSVDDKGHDELSDDGRAAAELGRLDDPLDLAVRHLGMAATLLPDDAAAHFQLASALEERARVRRIRSAREEEEAGTLGKASIAEDLRRAVSAFEEAARLERASLDATGGIGVAARTGDVAGPYLDVLRRMRQASLVVGDDEKVLWTIDQECLLSSSKMPFAIEDQRNDDDGVDRLDNDHLSKYEWLMGGTSVIDAPNRDGSRHVALRTTGNVPILGREVVIAIRNAANEHWAKNRGENSSRFTMQFQGNSEVHLADLVANSPWLKETIDNALQRRVYPLIRKVFSEDGMEMPEGPLCVYDSLVVRYDGDAARQHGVIGAMQPLHRDGGLFSVNIALNPPDSFSGGGTFLEGIFGGAAAANDGDGLPPPTPVRLPVAPGHALLHRSTERHAGAPTTAGVREILVLFVAARPSAVVRLPPSSSPATSADAGRGRGGEPSCRATGVERAFHLKLLARQQEDWSGMIKCYEMALAENPDDGEAAYWLGFHMVKGRGSANINSQGTSDNERRRREIISGVTFLEKAARLCPCDAKAFFYLAAGRLKMSDATHGDNAGRNSSLGGDSMEQIVRFLETALALDQVCQAAGCPDGDGIDVPSALLYIAEARTRQGKYRDAYDGLSGIITKIQRGEYGENINAPFLLNKANALAAYCEQRF